MGNQNDIRVVLGSLRFKSASDTNLFFQVPLVQNEKQLTEYDRSFNVGLEQVFDDERQRSDEFRPTAKFTILFQNGYSGATNYIPFENNMYYLNAREAKILECSPNNNPNSISWTGLPQFHEFDFIRNDYNVSGYTQPPNEHILFTAKSATSYNWNFFLSYAYDNVDKNLQYIDISGQTILWSASTGIPFVIAKRSKFNGRPLVSFRCGMRHGLSAGEFVELSSNFTYNGTNLFQVYSLGDENYGSDEYIFNFIDVGYTGSTFNQGQFGTFKRVILDSNSADTKSKYYIRRNKILTNPEDATLTKSGFEQGIFGQKRKYESSGLTPNGIARVSILEGNPSYNLSFDKKFRISPLLDNQKRPISELFFSIIWKGYFGWTCSSQIPGFGLKQGWDFNLPLYQGQPNIWWSSSQNLSNCPSPLNTLGSYTRTQNGTTYNFYYVNSPKEGDIIDGDFCEWNDYEQKERVISEIHHKFKYNPNNFNIGGVNTNPFGYYYKPHWKLTTRVFSDYIEEGDPKFVDDIPSYSYFSTTKNSFIWRDLYPYGFVDTSGLGVDYPFLNNVHYPHENYFFRIIPEGTNYNIQTIIAEPIIDNCE
jgi:hypothetical protein